MKKLLIIALLVVGCNETTMTVDDFYADRCGNLDEGQPPCLETIGQACDCTTHPYSFLRPWCGPFNTPDTSAGIIDCQGQCVPLVFITSHMGTDSYCDCCGGATCETNDQVECSNLPSSNNEVGICPSGNSCPGGEPTNSGEWTSVFDLNCSQFEYGNGTCYETGYSNPE